MFLDAFRRRFPVVAFAAACALSAAACDDSPASYDGPVDWETFVATYVDLRLSALGTPTGVITDAERTRVLEKHGVTEDDLLGFADAWGADPAAMRGVWEDVQNRLRAAAGEDTVASGEAR